MASRVNTKFVVLLIVIVIAMLGGLFAAYRVVYKTADDLSKMGDKAYSEGNYEQARLLYAKSVNKDPTVVENLDKWIDTLERWTPDTETAYYAAFRENYMGAIHQAARVQRNDVEAYHRELGLQFELFTRMYSRGLGDGIITRTSEVLRNFDGVPGVDESWPTLRRYRGIAWERIAINGGLVEETQFEVIREDLEAALAADPSDEAAMSSLLRWMIYEAANSTIGDNSELVKETRKQAVEMAREYVLEHPEAASVHTSVVSLEMELARSDAMGAESVTDSQQTQAVLDALQSFKPQMDNLEQVFTQIPAEKLSLGSANNFRLVETLADPDAKYRRSKALMKRIAEANPETPDILLSYASVLTAGGDHTEAAEWFGRVSQLEIPPLSVDGYAMFNARRDALISLASISLDRYERMRASGDADQGEIDKLLAESKEARDRYAGGVTEDNVPLMLINGRIAYAENNKEEALRLFSQFNLQSSSPRIDGLWLEAITARDLNQLGTAREALQRIVGLQRFNIGALNLLADISVRLKENDRAKEYFEQVLLYEPSNRTARDGIANINALQNPELIDDPILSLILTARQLRSGTDSNPGDLTGAIALLQDGIAELNYNPDVTRELITMLIDQGKLDEARGILGTAIAQNPDNPALNNLSIALQNDDETDIVASMIRLSTPDETAMHLALANLGSARSRPDIVNESLERLEVLAPNNPLVIDLMFVKAINENDMDTAKIIADRATENNTDRVNGLSFQARLASSMDDHARAALLLSQAATIGGADSSLFRLLAFEQRELGQIEASIGSYERALSIRPDDQASILAYVNTLILAQRYPAALDVARRYQRFAQGNPEFMSYWLTLESSYGGDEGLEFAMLQRERYLELNPNDLANKAQLANLYIQTKRWDESRVLIDELRAAEDTLQVVELEARWSADQGRVGNTPGLIAARQAYLQYIERQEDGSNSDPYISLARFMLGRGRSDLATQAAMSAVELEDPATLEGTKLIGDLYSAINNYTLASEMFQKIVDAGIDENDQYRMRLVNTLISTRQFEKAQTQFKLMSDENQNARIPMLQNAEIELGLGNRNAAGNLLDQAVAKYSDDALVYIKRAEFNTGDESAMTDMLADIDAALKINANDWRAYRIRASAFFAVDNRDEALRDLQRAVRLNPTLDRALFGIVNELMIDGRNSEAYDFAAEIADQRPLDASLMDSLGDLFSSRGDWDNASAFYKRLWDVQRSPFAGATLIDAIVRTRSPDTALANSIINDLTQIAGDIDDSPGLLAAQALVLQARGRDELALQQLTKAFDLSANEDAFLIQWSGNITRYFEEQPMQDQISYLETLKRRNPNAEVLNWLDIFIAQRLVSVGSQVDTAYGIFERLLDASSQPTLQQIAHQSYGTSMYAQERWEEAAEVWTKGVELFPDDWEMSNNLAYVMSASLGDHEGALELAKRSVASGPERSEPYDTLGRIYISLGQFELAKETINSGLQFAQTVNSRVTLSIAQIKLNLAQGQTEEARSKLVDIRSLIRSMPTRNIALEQQVEDIEAEIDSAEG